MNNSDLSKVIINAICKNTFLLIRYLILSQILLNKPKSNNIKCLILSSRDIINPSFYRT